MRDKSVPYIDDLTEISKDMKVTMSFGCDTNRVFIYRDNKLIGWHKTKPKEQAMQEFENGQEVEVSGDRKEWWKAEYIGKCRLAHVVDVVGKTDLGKYQDCYIRPVQLICDEAREKLKEFGESGDSVMFYIESEEQQKEATTLLGFNNYIIGGARLIAWKGKGHTITSLDHRVAGHCKQKQLPELNLSTGKVTPCEGDSKGVDMSIESAYKIIAELRDQLKEKDVYIKECLDSIKSKDGRICDLKVAQEAGVCDIADMINQLKEKDAEVIELKIRVKDLLDGRERYEDARKRQDAEINGFKASNSELCDKLKKNEARIERDNEHIKELVTCNLELLNKMDKIKGAVLDN